MAEAKQVVVPFTSAVLIDAIRGDDEQDTRPLLEMAAEAARYVRSFDWCLELHEQYLRMA
jgi:hypothetical protein